MRTGAMDAVSLLGRVMMAAIFLVAGYNKANAPTATMGYFGKLGLPEPGIAYAVTLAVEIGIAVLFLVGFRTRIMALILAVWCIATAFAAHYHPFEMVQFMKNVCMAGGFLQIVAYGAGRLSIDRK